MVFRLPILAQHTFCASFTQGKTFLLLAMLDVNRPDEVKVRHGWMWGVLSLFFG
jgi:hypothetical protein